MTTTRKRPCRPHIGMTIEQAAEYMRSRWILYCACKGNPAPTDTCTLKELMSYYPSTCFNADLRDCGWCLGHSGGFKAMEKAHDLAIQGMDWEWEGHDFSRKIDFAFDGIAGWLA